ncbi:hypothetical protein ACFL27_14160 [candidate division CSSED10-310 bacterium]|uniref:O-antigen ligase domain-containing protein n=1 Tax=candidate division CSSED10-310 bacterium TaxID=2855610 RepID=A0ABV6YYS1_UNCC1
MISENSFSSQGHRFQTTYEISLVVLFGLCFLLTFILQIIWIKEFYIIPFCSKLCLVFLFYVITRFRGEYGVYIFLVTVILSGFSGLLHNIYSWLYLSLCFLFILLYQSLGTYQKFCFVVNRFRKSPLGIPLLVSGFGVPLLGIANGFIQHNNRSYLLRDADGWIFFLIYFCLIGIIRENAQFRKLILVFIYAIISLAFYHSALYYCYLFGGLEFDFLNTLLYKVLNLGGHLTPNQNGFLRIYTGNGIFLIYGICFGLMMLLHKQKFNFVKWLFFLAVLSHSLIISYTRGFWVAVILAVLLMFLFLPGHVNKKVFLILGVCLILVAIFSYFIFDKSPLQLMKGEFKRISISLLALKKTESIFEITSSQEILKIPVAGSPTVIKLKQYYALYLHTKEKPLLGHGFGATLPGKYTFRFSEKDIKCDKVPHIFEAGYGDLLMKVGLVGFCSWFILIGAILYQSFLLFRQADSSCKLLIIVIILPLPGLLFTFGTNPYIFSPYGIIPLVLSAFLVEHMTSMKRLNRSVECEQILEGS